MLKIIGAGFGRTGTLSLKAALERLGFAKCYHIIDLFSQPEQVSYWEAAARGETVDWPVLFTGYQAIIDFLGCCFYQELLRQYPGAKVILTVREPEQWYASTLKTIYRPTLDWPFMLQTLLKIPFSRRLRRLPRVIRLLNRLIFQELFNGQFKDQQYALSVYHSHVDEVQRIVPQEQLLVFSVKDGWGPLCKFLEVPMPKNEPFPHINTREEHMQIVREFIRRA